MDQTLPLGSQQRSSLARPSSYIGPFNLLNLTTTATHGSVKEKPGTKSLKLFGKTCFHLYIFNLVQEIFGVLKYLKCFSFINTNSDNLRDWSSIYKMHKCISSEKMGPRFEKRTPIKGAWTPNYNNHLIPVGLIFLDLVGTTLFPLSRAHRDFNFTTHAWGSMVKVLCRKSNEWWQWCWWITEAWVAAESQRRTSEESLTSSAAFEAGHKQWIRIGLEYMLALTGVTLNRV